MQVVRKEFRKEILGEGLVIQLWSLVVWKQGRHLNRAGKGEKVTRTRVHLRQADGSGAGAGTEAGEGVGAGAREGAGEVEGAGVRQR